MGVDRKEMKLKEVVRFGAYNFLNKRKRGWASKIDKLWEVTRAYMR